MEQLFKSTTKKEYSSAPMIILLALVALVGTALTITTVGVGVGLLVNPPTSTIAPPITVSTVAPSNTTVAPPTNTTTVAPNKNETNQAYIEKIQLFGINTSNVFSENLTNAICRTLTIMRIINGICWQDGPFYVRVFNQTSINSSDWYVTLYYENDSCLDNVTCLQSRNTFLKTEFAKPIPVVISTGEKVNFVNGTVKLPEFLSTEGQNISQSENILITGEENLCSNLTLVYNAVIDMESSMNTTLNELQLSRAICRNISSIQMERDKPFYIKIKNITRNGMAINAMADVFYNQFNCYSLCVPLRNTSIALDFQNLSVTFLNDPNNNTTKVTVTIKSIYLTNNGTDLNEATLLHVRTLSQQCSQNQIRYETTVAPLPAGVDKNNTEISLFFAMQQIHMNIVNWTHGPFLIELNSNESAYINYDFMDCTNIDCKSQREMFLQKYLTNISLLQKDSDKNLIVSVIPKLSNEKILKANEGIEAMNKITEFPKFYSVYDGKMNIIFFNDSQKEANLSLENIQAQICVAVNFHKKDLNSAFSVTVLNGTTSQSTLQAQELNVLFYYSSEGCRDLSVCIQNRVESLDRLLSESVLDFGKNENLEILAKARYNISFNTGRVARDDFNDTCSLL
ncbi:hypothetical protein GJ496_000356 [Pomphorhynchus laevis]|nr:hypothetical protein GJ496_000356 [Pomphorhynchus laevis]